MFLLTFSLFVQNISCFSCSSVDLSLLNNKHVVRFPEIDAFLCLEGHLNNKTSKTYNKYIIFLSVVLDNINMTKALFEMMHILSFIALYITM